MKRQIFLPVSILMLGACYTGIQDLCPKHCWDFTQPVDNEAGYFPSGGIHGGECYSEAFPELTFAPPLPSPAEFTAKVCLDTQAEHDSVKAVIEAIRCGPSCFNMVDQGDVDIYDALAYDVTYGSGLATELRLACRAYLGTQGCDITAGIDGNHVLAWDLCDEYARDPAEAALKDHTGCNGWVPPSEVVGEYKASDPYDCDYHPDLATTGADDGPICDGDGGDEGLDETSAMRSGDVFGDLESLVDCGQPTTCVIGPELLVNVTENFQTFYDEEVWLEMVAISGVGNGAQITGVDPSEDVEALLDAFGIQDDDVITHVNSVELDQAEDVLEVLHAIALASSWSVTVRRWNGTSWSTLNYSISVAT